MNRIDEMQTTSSFDDTGHAMVTSDPLSSLLPRSVLPFGKPYYDDAEVRAVTEVLRNGDIATGRIVSQFESAFAREFGFHDAVAVSSGSMANLLAVAVLVERGEVSPGDRVLVSGSTFVSAVTPVAQFGLVPIFVDTEPDGVNVAIDLVARAVAEHQAAAMLLPHALGQALDGRRLSDVCRKHGTTLIEDCCESLGARHDGRLVGNSGSMATFSFYAGHHLTMGEGGVVACHDPSTAELLRSLRSFGRDPVYAGTRFGYAVGERRIAPDERYIHLRLGYNAKLTDFQAAFGLVQLTRHEDLATERRRTAQAVCDVVAGRPGWSVLGAPAHPEYSPFAVALRLHPNVDIAQVGQAFTDVGIETRGFLGAAMPDQPCFDGTEFRVHEPYHNAYRHAKETVLIGCPPGIDLVEAGSILDRALEGLS